jgi:hypothetical protein
MRTRSYRRLLFSTEPWEIYAQVFLIRHASNFGWLAYLDAFKTSNVTSHYDNNIRDPSNARNEVNDQGLGRLVFMGNSSEIGRWKSLLLFITFLAPETEK